jgi:hypothetical protein
VHFEEIQNRDKERGNTIRPHVLFFLNLLVFLEFKRKVKNIRVLERSLRRDFGSETKSGVFEKA